MLQVPQLRQQHGVQLTPRSPRASALSPLRRTRARAVADAACVRDHRGGPPGSTGARGARSRDGRQRVATDAGDEERHPRVARLGDRRQTASTTRRGDSLPTPSRPPRRTPTEHDRARPRVAQPPRAAHTTRPTSPPPAKTIAGGFFMPPPYPRCAGLDPARPSPPSHAADRTGRASGSTSPRPFVPRRPASPRRCAGGR